jgi:hypothetical protein
MTQRWSDLFLFLLSMRVRLRTKEIRLLHQLLDYLRIRHATSTNAGYSNNPPLHYQDPILHHFPRSFGPGCTRLNHLSDLPLLSSASTDALARHTTTNTATTRSTQRPNEAPGPRIDAGSFRLGEELVQSLDLFESVGCQLTLARNKICQPKKRPMYKDRISYTNSLMMDRILSHGHVLRVRRGDRVVDIAAHELRVGAHRFDQIHDHIGQALGARANLFCR